MQIAKMPAGAARTMPLVAPRFIFAVSAYYVCPSTAVSHRCTVDVSVGAA